MAASDQPNPSAANPEAPIATLLRRFFPLYCVLVAAVTWGYALYDRYQLDGDAINYMDIGDLLRAHQWAGIINGYWHPMYPAFLSIGHIVFRSTLANELHAYYMVNFVIFLMEMAAIVAFTDAILHLRAALDPGDETPAFLLGKYSFRYLGLALLVIASQRELSLGKVRPDALLQAFLLLAFAALLNHLATGRIRYAALMGLALGCAYLTKSFAFVLAFLCIVMLAAFRWLWLKHSFGKIIAAKLVVFLCFAVIAGPYVAALSHQKHRLDFGDSGSLNLAWYVGGTEKMHLQPYQTSQFGSADVHLKHPERELLHAPQIFSYAALPYGTYPDWFDPTYWNDQVKPHLNLRGELSRSARNMVLVVRYLFNHPEALILLALFLALGARLTLTWRIGSNAFWLVPFLLGVLIWTIYATVNTEERYVAVAYICILLSLFATLRIPASSNLEPRTSNLPSLASTLIFLLALLVTGESLRTVFEARRELATAGLSAGWYSPQQQHAAIALKSMGLRPGDAVACVGAPACIGDYYWARLAQLRILTEIYNPTTTPTYAFFDQLPNRAEAIATVRAQGAKVLVGDFAGAPVNDVTLAVQGWQQLGDSTLYELPLNVPPGTVPQRPAPPAPRKPSI